MDRIKIIGGQQLNGVIPISGAKNAALPLMIASLMTDDTLTLENVPHLADVEQLIRILGNHGVDYSVNGRRGSDGSLYSRTIHFTARNIVTTTAPYELVSKMRASFWVVYRYQEAVPLARVQSTCSLKVLRHSAQRLRLKMAML
jgi:UDP-N-acetylglucosamine 1-carboxyvinyltransferase